MKNVGSIVVDIANTIALHDLPNRLAIIPTISLPRKRSSSSNGTYTCYENIYICNSERAVSQYVDKFHHLVVHLGRIDATGTRYVHVRSVPHGVNILIFSSY